MSARKVVRGVAKAGLVVALAAGAGNLLTSSAFGAEYGNEVHNCYGIFWNTDWNQECGSGGAAKTGTYKSDADCTASGDQHLEKHRNSGSTASYDGEDCAFDVWMVTTWYK